MKIVAVTDDVPRYELPLRFLDETDWHYKILGRPVLSAMLENDQRALKRALKTRLTQFDTRQVIDQLLLVATCMRRPSEGADDFPLACVKTAFDIAPTLFSDAVNNRNVSTWAWYSADSGKTGMLKFFLDLGISIDAAHNNKSLLYGAIHFNHKETVELLLEQGADPNYRTMNANGSWNNPVWHEALRSDRCHLLERLIQSGADVQHEFLIGTALHVCVNSVSDYNEDQFRQVFKLLVDGGVDPLAKFDGKSFDEFAYSAGQFEIFKAAPSCLAEWRSRQLDQATSPVRAAPRTYRI